MEKLKSHDNYLKLLAIKSEIVIKEEPIENDDRCSSEERSLSKNTLWMHKDAFDKSSFLAHSYSEPVKMECGDDNHIYPSLLLSALNENVQDSNINDYEVKIEQVTNIGNVQGKNKENICDLNSFMDESILFRRIKESKYPKVILKKIDDEIKMKSENLQNVSAASEVTCKSKTSDCSQSTLNRKLNKLHKDFADNIKTVGSVGLKEFNNDKSKGYIGLKDFRSQSNDISNKIYKCAHCRYQTNYRGSLKKQLLIHSKIKSFKCSECDYKCDQKGTIKLHLLKHSNIKLFKCSECNYKCNQKDQLKRHILAHSNVKLFKCSECDYKCNYKGHLKQHINTFKHKIIHMFGM